MHKNNNKIFNNNSLLTEEEKTFIKKEIICYENPRSALIEALKIIQKNRKWISDEIIVELSKLFNVNVSEIESIATFYSYIFRKPVGRHIIRYCDSLVCFIMGYENILNTLKNCLNISPGETTINNRFTMIPTSCLGCCDRSPVIMINEDVYCNISCNKINKLLENYL